uniref:Glucan endo-1,3-beta-D-glucosidase n=1 Tax=Kalanchoe fedtschenkoi TaxID=63787 RepID=A0A7N0V044_KALFE
MAPSQLFILSLFLLIPFAVAQTSAAIGVTYTTSPSTADRVARFVESVNISAVRLPDANPDAIRSFSSTNISLLLTIPSSMVPEIGANRSNAAVWVHQHVVPYYPRARISAISVGHQQHSLHEIGMQNISVSTTFSFRNLITDIFPSRARFRSPVDCLLIRPLLQFLSQTKRPEIPIEFALFKNLTHKCEDSGVRYSNLFDMMVDAVHSAMAVSGWPSSGYRDKLKATRPLAEKYVTGLVEHLKSGVGTSLRKEGVAEAYMYELFDRDDEQEVKRKSRQWAQGCQLCGFGFTLTPVNFINIRFKLRPLDPLDPKSIILIFNYQIK